VLQAAALARRGKDDGIASVALDPGVAMTGLQRTMPWWVQIIVRLIAQNPEIGAYTQLYAGLQPDLDVHKPGSWVIPPGKLVSGRADLFDRELSERFWEWTEEQVKAYL
jgi:hypothetical protein